MTSVRWHVLGAGAIGRLWSARLTRAMQDNRSVLPVLILRNETWSELGKPSKWTIRVNEQHSQASESSSWSADVFTQPLSATDPIQHLLVTTKAPDVYQAMEDVLDRLLYNAVVVLLYNGMGAYEKLISDTRFRDISFMLAVTTNGVFATKRLTCVHAGHGDTWVGKPPGSLLRDEDARAAVASLQLSGLPVELDEHIIRTQWEKLAVNASINGITAIINCKNGALLENPHGMSLVTNICTEVAQVMKASGIPPSPSTKLLSKVSRVLHQCAENFSSMQQDMSMGRPTEIDYINGFVVKQGVRFGVPTPTNRAIIDLVRMKEQLRT